MNWTCHDTRRSMLRQLELSDDALEHLASCELCQQVADVAMVTRDDDDAGPSLDLERLLTSTQSEIDRERGIVAWLRSRPLWVQLMLGLVTALLPVALQLVFARRGDLADLPMARLASFVVAYAVSIAYAAAAMLSPLYRTRASANVSIAAVLAAAVPLLFVVTNHEGFTSGAGFGFGDAAAAFSCLRYGVVLAIPSVVLVLAMDRTATRKWVMALVAAAFGGAVGNFVLLLHCANRESAHQLLGHASSGVVLAILIGVVGRFARIGPAR